MILSRSCFKKQIQNKGRRFWGGKKKKKKGVAAKENTVVHLQTFRVLK